MCSKKNGCAIVTGAATGIGAAAAIRLARDGFNLVLNYHTDKRFGEISEIKDICEKSGVQAIIKKADVSNSSDCKMLVDAAVDTFGSIDVLVNNASILKLKPMWQMSDEIFDEVMKTNAYSVFFLMKHAAAYMKKQKRGRIINISSVGGMYGSPWSIGYGASKGAVIAMTKTAAKELAMYNILVNAIAPGGVDTGMMTYHPQQLNDTLKFITLKRMSEPSEIAGAISFFASEDSSYVTGHVLEVSGGAMM